MLSRLASCCLSLGVLVLIKKTRQKLDDLFIYVQIIGHCLAVYLRTSHCGGQLELKDKPHTQLTFKRVDLIQKNGFQMQRAIRYSCAE